MLVGTPIGNLGDLSARARAALAEADVICCEDTRRTRALLSAVGVGGGSRLVSVHEHNEVARIPQVLEWLAAGRLVAVVTDAGLPGISDPGERLVAAAADGGFEVVVVPGPSSVLAALVASGLPTARFCMEGFLPRKGAPRRSRLAALAAEERTAVILEAPPRLAATLRDLLAVCGDRPVDVARELTKVHEEVWRGTLGAAATRYDEHPVRGEVVLVLGGALPDAPASDEDIEAAVRSRLAEGAGPREVAASVAAALGVSKRVAYTLAIELRGGDEARP